MKQSHTDFIDRVIPDSSTGANGVSFQFEGYSCIPVLPEQKNNFNDPLGFILTRGNDVVLLRGDAGDDVERDTWQRVTEVWASRMMTDAADNGPKLPSEYWFG